MQMNLICLKSQHLEFWIISYSLTGPAQRCVSGKNTFLHTLIDLAEM